VAVAVSSGRAQTKVAIAPPSGDALPSIAGSGADELALLQAVAAIINSADHFAITTDITSLPVERGP